MVAPRQPHKKVARCHYAEAQRRTVTEKRSLRRDYWAAARSVTHSLFYARAHQCAQRRVPTGTLCEKTAPIQPPSRHAERRGKCPLFQRRAHTLPNISPFTASAQRLALPWAISSQYTETNQPFWSNFNVWAASKRHRMFHWVVWWRLGSTGWDARRQETHGWDKRRHLWD